MMAGRKGGESGAELNMIREWTCLMTSSVRANREKTARGYRRRTTD
jgi:hypothetical protein